MKGIATGVALASALGLLLAQSALADGGGRAGETSAFDKLREQNEPLPASRTDPPESGTPTSDTPTGTPTTDTPTTTPPSTPPTTPPTDGPPPDDPPPDGPPPDGPPDGGGNGGGDTPTTTTEDGGPGGGSGSPGSPNADEISVSPASASGRVPIRGIIVARDGVLFGAPLEDAVQELGGLAALGIGAEDLTPDSVVGVAYHHDDTMFLDLRRQRPEREDARGETIRLSRWIQELRDSRGAGVSAIPLAATAGGSESADAILTANAAKATRVDASYFAEAETEDAIPEVARLPLRAGIFPLRLGPVHAVDGRLIVLVEPVFLR